MMSQWTFLTNHAQVLLAIAASPRITARAIALKVDVTERAVQRIIADLEAEGYLTRVREGRSNVYQVNRDQPMRHPAQQGLTVGALLRVLEGPGASEQAE
jgi:predicted ArsR family transcriptional regulator